MKTRFHVKLIASSIIASGLATAHAAPPQMPNPLENVPFANQTANGFDLRFDASRFDKRNAEVDGQTIAYRAVEKIVYVKNPVVADYQTINVYVPEAYFNQQNINGYTAQTAPIFLPNSIGGYMPAMAATAATPARNGKTNSILQALSRGYVVVTVGARGRTLQNSEGTYTGKAPAAIIDLKAAVRYLRANDALMAGDAEKIISNGTSAGGAMSALLGASGDAAEYRSHLAQLGAADVSDAIFATSAYCPITNLEHADMAYEWQFHSLKNYSVMNFARMNADSYNNRTGQAPSENGTLTAAQIAVSEQLKNQFPAYLNSLNLKDQRGRALTLDENGNGSFKNHIANLVGQAAQNAINQGQDLSNIQWLTIENKRVTAIDFDGFVQSKNRFKTPPAFDALDLSSGENNLFGNEKTDRQHFTDYGAQHSSANGTRADATAVRLMNPMHHIANPQAAAHWRIRVGTADYDTSHAISAILATSLQMSGKNVDYALAWNVPHSGDYDLPQLFDWIDQIAKSHTPKPR